MSSDQVAVVSAGQGPVLCAGGDVVVAGGACLARVLVCWMLPALRTTSASEQPALVRNPTPLPRTQDAHWIVLVQVVKPRALVRRSVTGLANRFIYLSLLVV